MNNEITVEQLKKLLDILTVAELYGEVVKNGANYKYKDNTSIVINPAKQIFSDFNGSITGGSVLDLVMYMEKIDLAQGINRLKTLSGNDDYIIDPSKQLQRKEEEKAKKVIDFQKLGYFGTKEINDVKYRRPAECLDKNSILTHYMVITEFAKLFETTELPKEYGKKIDYLFSNILGWSNFWNCPSIILRDDNNRIVDIISYRPTKPANYKDWENPKYIYKNSHNRGDHFLYPFRKEVEHILDDQSIDDRYLIIGEGIKNGLNALLYSVPYIPLESTSNKINQALIDYIKNYHTRGFSIITMFDGDKAGAKAHENFISQLGLPIENFFDFDSGLDFVNYLQSEDK